MQGKRRGRGARSPQYATKESQKLFSSFIFQQKLNYLIVVSDDFSSSLSSTGFVVGHDTVRGGHNDFPELTGWKKVHNPLFDVTNTAIKAWGDNTTLVNSTNKFNNNFLRSVIIDDFIFSNVSMFLHNSKELDNDLGDWSEEDLNY